MENLLNLRLANYRKTNLNEEKKMKKSIMAISGMTMILMSFLASAIYLNTASAADPTSWYQTVNGVLATDTYDLYPFDDTKSLKIGFSQFGEMINTLENVGLEYGDVDPFAPPGGGALGSIVKSAWLQGWLCNITYYHTIRSERRVVWTSAQQGDPMGVTFGNNWIRVDFPLDYNGTYGVEDPRDPGYLIGNYAAGGNTYGGRKTNGTAITAPIRVLYDGPRSFVARLTTTIYDHFLYGSDDISQDIPLLEVRITLLFNKVKKEVVLFKELKTLVSDKYTDQMKVQFSNRGEVDLGKEGSGYASYFHFYTQGTSQYNPNFNDTEVAGQPTVYDRNWVLNVTENPASTAFANYSSAGPYPQDSSATYDVAVAINPTINYTWWAAFWPSLSNWNIDGWPMWYRSMDAFDPHNIDSRTWETIPRNEPTIPYYIGEWDAVLFPAGKLTPAGYPDQQQYRFVTVYGVTGLNDGFDDQQQGRQSNNIDRETKYLLNEYFNPWDLETAVHKETRRWVDWTFGTSYTTTSRPVINVNDENWDQYCTFSERVFDLNTSTLMKRIKYVGGELRTPGYYAAYNSDGTMTITGLLSTHYYKILYSTYPEVDTYRSKAVSIPLVTAVNKTLGQTITVASRTLSDSWTDNIGVGHSFTTIFDAFDVTLTESTATNWTATWTMSTKKWNETDFKVFLGETYTSAFPGIADPTNVTATHSETTSAWFLFGIDQMVKTVTAPTDSTVISPLPKETVHVVSLNHTLDVTVTVVNKNYTGNAYGLNNATTVITYTTTQRADYNDKLMGRYELVVVGRDAASVDSAGASLVTAAFKNKQVEIGIAAADMYTDNVANQMPWVMAKIGAGTTWSDYYYNKWGGSYTGDYRTALQDDWCHTWPVSSSNMLGIGGPLANMLAYYDNDFADVIFGLDSFTNDTAWENQIVPKTCWNLHSDDNTYASSNTTGYGVITTYKDINGTVIFLLWGHWGRDTYYLTKWFHEHGVYQLQEAPAGLTSIIVEITYDSYPEGYKPTDYTVIECLGTISETAWIHEYRKGGIHDP